jgi:hypothetical protein
MIFISESRTARQRLQNEEIGDIINVQRKSAGIKIRTIEQKESDYQNK